MNVIGYWRKYKTRKNAVKLYIRSHSTHGGGSTEKTAASRFITRARKNLMKTEITSSVWDIKNKFPILPD